MPSLRQLSVAVLALVATGCGPQVIVTEDEGTTGRPKIPQIPSTASTTRGDPSTSGPPDADGGVTSLPPADGDTGADPPPPSSDGDGLEGAFIDTPDGGGSFECDLFAQDCPAGDKCMPWANDGGSNWNAERCSPIARAPGQVGEPCTVEGSEVSGLDDCDVGLMCLHVAADTLQGTCVSMCTGSADAPICNDGLTCAIGNDGAIVLCLPPCNPLADDCTPGTCTPFGDDVFACFVDGTHAPPGDSCELSVDCGAGSTCRPEDTTGDCGEATLGSCCTSLCDLNAADPSAACLPGQACAPWYRPGEAMPPLDAVGVCTIES